MVRALYMQDSRHWPHGALLLQLWQRHQHKAISAVNAYIMVVLVHVGSHWTKSPPDSWPPWRLPLRWGAQLCQLHDVI